MHGPLGARAERAGKNGAMSTDRSSSELDSANGETLAA